MLLPYRRYFFFAGAALRTCTASLPSLSLSSAATCSSGTTELPSEAAKPFLNCPMTATNFSIADPDDAGMLDVAGFDQAVPNLIAEFSRGL